MNKEKLVNFLSRRRVLISTGVIVSSVSLAPVLGGNVDRLVGGLGALTAAYLALDGYHTVRRRLAQKASAVESERVNDSGN